MGQNNCDRKDKPYYLIHNLQEQLQLDIKKTEHYCTRYFSDLRVTLGFKQNVKKASENKLNSILCTFDSVVKLAKSSTLRHSKDDFTHSIFIRTVSSLLLLSTLLNQ